MNLEVEFEKAAEGRKIWLALEERYETGLDSGLFIFPTDNDAVNRETLQLLPAYLERYHLGKVYAVTNQETVMQMLENLSVQKTVGIELSDDEMDSLLKYYRMVHFSPHIVMVSLEEPFGNDYLLQKKKIGLKDFIMSALFKMR